MDDAKKQAIFETLPVRSAVRRQIIPAIVSQMIVLLYNIADTYFVGWLDDPRQTAAVTIAAPSFLMLTAVSNLFGVGGASLVAQSLGKRDLPGAKAVSAAAAYAGLVSALLFSLLFLSLANPVLRLCGATGSTLPYALGYANWVVTIGGIATVLNTLLANLLRAEGNAVAASFGVSLGGILNILLDALFVLPQCLGFGVIGAGAATAISNMCAAAFFLCYILKKRDSVVISLSPACLRPGLGRLGAILKTGFPSAVQYALTVVAVAAQSKFVSRYETEAVAGLGIVKKLDQLPLYFSIGVANGLMPLLAYNHASGNDARRTAAFRFGCFISFGFSLLCLVCYELFAPWLAGLFIDNPLTREYGAAFLRLMVLAMPMMSVCYPLIIQFQAMGKIRESLICSVLRKGVLDIPLLFFMDALLPLYGCMLVQPIVDAVSLVVALMLYRGVCKRSAPARHEHKI